MISFAPFITYEMDKCFLTELECIGAITVQMADWDDDLSCDVLDSLHSLDYVYWYDKDRNQTRFDFGSHTAKFTFYDGRNKVQLLIYEMGHTTPIFTHIFTDDEMMDFVDYSSYCDPERMADE